MDELPVIDALWDYRDPPASERAFQTLVDTLPDDTPPPYRAELLTQLARSQALQRRFTDADATLDVAEAVPGGATGRVRVRARLERGRIRRDLQENDVALALFREAWDLAGEHQEHALALDAAHMLGYAAAPAEAVAWGRRAIAIAASSEDPQVRRWLGTLHMNLATHLLTLERFDEAQHAFRAAERARREHGRERGARDARAGFAGALRRAGRPEEALEVAAALLAESGIDPTWNGYAHEEAAEALLALGRRDEARTHFATAHPILAADPWFPPDQGARLERIRRLGEPPETA